MKDREKKPSTVDVSTIGANLLSSDIPAEKQTKILAGLIELADPNDLEQLVNDVEQNVNPQIGHETIRRAREHFKVEENEGE